mgnify:CR=1 FL=1
MMTGPAVCYVWSGLFTQCRTGMTYDGARGPGLPGHPPGPGPHPPVASDAWEKPVAAAMRLVTRFFLLLACIAALSACADNNPRLDDNARAASDHGNGGPQGEWGSLGGGWGGSGSMGW